MDKLLYPKIALSNMRNNKSIYLPYLLSSSLIISVFYILRCVAYMVAISDIASAGNMSMILTLSSVICGVFSVLIIFYVNSFIIKRRKKEFGLYSILGMEKKHISFVMIFETVFSATICLVCGVVGGAVFSQLLFLLLLKLSGIPSKLVFAWPLSELGITIALFGIVYIAILIYNIISIVRTAPIDLLKSTNKGEKEPKARWLLALIGFGCLFSGYAISLSAKTSSMAFMGFLPAVILVIFGTMGVFTAGSIAVLKLLRKNKNFYYKSKNFVSVSGMIYRMKQNAVGLANICIFSTAILVTLASTICLYIGEEDTLKVQYPYMVKTGVETQLSTPGQVQQTALQLAFEEGVKIKNDVNYTLFTMVGTKTNNSFNSKGENVENMFAVSCYLLEDYNKIQNTSYVLENNEALVYTSDNSVATSSVIEIDGMVYNVKQAVDDLNIAPKAEFAKSMTVVVKDMQQLELIKSKYNGENKNFVIVSYYCFDIEGDEQAVDSFYAKYPDCINAQTINGFYYTDIRENHKYDFYQTYGSFLFVGVFFIIIFAIATVIIIYYKQITEGYDDHDRFVIMQKVGMSDKEVKKTINTQVLMVFFLPLIMAIIHLLFAFPSLCQVLKMFGMTNIPLFIGCISGSALAFAAFYFIVYMLTAKTYFKIVRTK